MITKEILQKYQVFLRGHFVLASGRHTGEYVEKLRIFKNKVLASEVCQGIINDLFRFSDYSSNRIEIVVGPERGGKILAGMIASNLHETYKYRGDKRVLVFSTKKDKQGNQVLQEKYKKDIQNKNVLIVDDVLTTGRTLRQAIEEVKKAGGNILGIVVACKRNQGPLEKIEGISIISVQIELEIEDYPEEKCPLCEENIPINEKFGRGKEFLARKSKDRN